MNPNHQHPRRGPRPPFDPTTPDLGARGWRPRRRRDDFPGSPSDDTGFDPRGFGPRRGAGARGGRAGFGPGTGAGFGPEAGAGFGPEAGAGLPDRGYGAGFRPDRGYRSQAGSVPGAGTGSGQGPDHGRGHGHEHGHGHGPEHPRGRGFGPGFGPGGPRFEGRRGGPGGRRAGRGDIRAAILLLLAEQPMHGYQLIQEILDRSGGQWRPSPGAIYPALALLEDEGLVALNAESGRKMASLTDEGAAYVEANAATLGTPWQDAAERPAHPGRTLRVALDALGGAAVQVVRTGTEQQVTQALAVLEAARRDLYLILAGAAPAPTDEASASPTRAPASPDEPTAPTDEPTTPDAPATEA
jgi:DNA-binding PadR family transcriptional regulator